MGVWICIVEGDGDKKAVPTLLRRLMHEKFQQWTVEFRPYNAHGRGNLTAPGGIERLVTRAVRERGCEAILVVLDAEDDCPKERAKELAQRIRGVNPRVPVAVVIAHRCYEAWLLGGKDWTREPETVSPGAAKKEISGKLGRPYRETTDQEKLTAEISLDQAETRCRSFRRLVHAVEELIQATQSGSSQPVITPDP